MTQPTPVFAPDQVDFYLGDPHAGFARPRREDPLHWYEAGPFCCATKHSDVQAISRAPRVFSSAHGTQLFEIPLRSWDVTHLEPELGPQSIIRIGA